MTKIKCRTLNDTIASQNYTGPSGKTYEFTKGSGTVVNDPEDAMHFLKAGEGAYFEIDAPAKDVKNLFDKIKTAIADKIKASKAAEKEKADEVVAAAASKEADAGYYGLTAAEIDDAKADGTYEEVEAHTKEDTKKAREKFAKYADSVFGITLAIQKMADMKSAFWASWKAVEHQDPQGE